ncbi:MAG: orotate phosphoribosyltransferase [Acetivibrionales bacterium]
MVYIREYRTLLYQYPFSYGSERKANGLLEVINEEKGSPLTCPIKVLELARENYRIDPIYKGLIDEMCTFIKEKLNVENIGLVSGGERRDWFFSLLVAEIMDKPHLTIYKDLKTVVSIGNRVEETDSKVQGKNLLHIADLITKASSYERAWIPAVKKLGGQIKWSVAVVDRDEGGKEILYDYGIELFSMVNISKSLFDKALSMEIINNEQHKMVTDYINNPFESMKNFLISHPNFIEDSLEADERTQKRVRLCLDSNIYGLK